MTVTVTVTVTVALTGRPGGLKFQVQSLLFKLPLAVFDNWGPSSSESIDSGFSSYYY